MKRIDTSTRAIDLFGAGKDGFKDGNLGLGVAPTNLNALWFNQLQEEVANAVEAAGLALDASDLTQLTKAIRSLATGRLLRTSVYFRVGAVQYVSINGGAPTTVGAGTFTKLSATAFAIMDAWGAGGGSGGNLATTSGQHSFSAGGGGGSYGVRLETGAMSGLVITVGLAGAAGGNNGAGGNGGASSVGALLSSPGGLGSGAGTINAGISSAGPTSGGGAPSGANLYSMQGGDSGQALSAALGFVGSMQGGLSGSGSPKGYGAGAKGAYAGISSAVNSPGLVAPEGGLIVIREHS